MNSRFLLILILCVAVFMVWGVFYLSTHDRVQEVIDVNSIRLNKGRIVNLIGIEPTRVYEHVKPSAIDGDSEMNIEADSIQVITFFDTSSVKQISDFIMGKDIRLQFSNKFEPDTASIDLAAYVLVDDTVSLNEWILSHGLAKINEGHKHPRFEAYRHLALKAEKSGIGIWKAPDITRELEEEDDHTTGNEQTVEQ